ncbi:hypothetical protein LMG3458_03537 [Achromobacter deleyi]|uniref:PepSY domain-containing protein n=1 Tax=Achromobacter deleyi TaxID=1353891 RepID=A0A6S7AAE1_9BURK|nr:PepSY-associated TM helix domain-containing protein [Achromobacter deleyi]CAB3715881.1 hypothetical protein LMG3458_03537 [Achromobacter deleyi]CAB3850278.1 hypothetical protein LMG3482_01728 [Achromobacter deleyi]CAB3889301.1 hypothetical protein LMG3481_03683 [Achromobacter deleyi]
MASLLRLLHRWAGLFLALFLFVSGLTGAIISWDHELDEWLNPQLFDAPAPAGATLRPALDLAAGLEAADPRLRVAYLPLTIEPGHALGMSVVPRIDPATGRPYPLAFNQITLDPVTGAVRGSRYWGEVSLARENLMPFLYKLHYTLHLPDVGGFELGTWFMGIVAIIWALDCLIALAISFPSRKAWHKSLSFRLRQGRPKLVFDLHRAGGVWVWGLLLMVAVTSVSMNLGREVVRPLVAFLSPLTPDIFALRRPAAPAQFVEPGITRARALQLGQAEARERGWTLPAGALFYSTPYRLYGVHFFEPGDDTPSGLGRPWIYLDSQSGEVIGDRIPGRGSAGDVFLQAQLPLHTGRIIGLPGRVLMSALGLVVAMLSVTGVLLWARKRRARRQGRERSHPGT